MGVQRSFGGSAGQAQSLRIVVIGTTFAGIVTLGAFLIQPGGGHGNSQSWSARSHLPAGLTVAFGIHLSPCRSRFVMRNGKCGCACGWFGRLIVVIIIIWTRAVSRGGTGRHLGLWRSPICRMASRPVWSWRQTRGLRARTNALRVTGSRARRRRWMES